MNAIAYNAARTNWEQTMERVCEDHTPVVITRQDARPVVLMSLEDYQAIEETAYLLRSPANAARLAESLAQVAAGRVEERELAE